MMEILKRFEEDATNDEDFVLDDNGSDEDDDLALQLKTMDLGM